ncbi:MAG: diguanylate cyclase [Alphaproteobacteria bacterium]|nr:diguanylate cyclase [Alphaproteobacteria bacterium]
MRYWDLPEHAAEFGRKALALLEARGLAPSPVNYDLWFAYAVGENRELMRSLDLAVESGSIRDLDHACALHTKYIAGARAGAVDDLTVTLQTQISQLSGLLKGVHKETRAFGKTLDTAADQLGRDDVIPHLRAIVESVAAATQVMQARNEVLEQQLETSAMEVRVLNARIEEIHKEALIDPLTGLANRRGLEAKLQEATSNRAGSNRSFCVLMGDVDHFKQFNDKWGHSTGDQVLRLVAQAFKAHTQDGDTVARIGGEEFVVILADTTLERAVGVAEDICRAVSSKKVVRRATGETLGTVTVSVGIARYQPGEPIGDVIERADACMLAAKQAGRNGVAAQTDRHVQTGSAKGHALH